MRGCIHIHEQNSLGDSAHVCTCQLIGADTYGQGEEKFLHDESLL